MVGTSLGSSRLWFTVCEGILTEVYYPRIDIPQIRDLGFIIADDQGFWIELRRMDSYSVSLAAPGVPAVTVEHRHPRFVFRMEICPSQRRDVILLRYTLDGDPELHPYALLAPRLGGDAEDNRASVERHSARTVLWADQGPFALSLCGADQQGADIILRGSAGGFGVSDGWQDFHRNGRMSWTYEHAGPGCVALMGELRRQGRLALGFATSRQAAATLAISALMDDFDAEWGSQVAAWKEWHDGIAPPQLVPGLEEMFAVSASVLKIHEDRTYRGAAVASLSVPWGDVSQSRGGYHLIWSRDLVETAGGLVALGAYHNARDTLRYLIATQQEDGHWFQNQWLGGTAFWTGVQLDEVAFPVLLAAQLHDHGQLHSIPVQDMVVRALGFISRQGPATHQDRWEEDAGINTFTLAVSIAALVEGSQFLEPKDRDFALKLADYWNAQIERWAFVRESELARRLGTDGYFMRTVPLDPQTHRRAPADPVAIKNRAHDPDLPASAQVSTDFLQLVRYGLRRADDPFILDTLKAADTLLKTETPSGPIWHRYNDDGYGEHTDGRAFDGTGHGRGWPLLVGERGHHALLCGEDVEPYLLAMKKMANPLGLLPEQVWDSAPISAYGLEPGRPSGSAMPLVWAHSEFLKLCYSRVAGFPVDRPAATWARYGGERPCVDFVIWGPNHQPAKIICGQLLYIALRSQALVHWGVNGWQKIQDTQTDKNGLGLFVAQLDISELSGAGRIDFTFFWTEQQRWEGRDYAIEVVERG
jgi:glucoamylase